MLKILIIDNDWHLLRSLKFLLKRRSYIVTTLTTAETLLPVILEFQPDLILLDGELGTENGFKVCRDLKKSPLKDIPVFIMSYNNAGERKAYVAGAEGFIEKPFPLQNLLSKVYLISGALFN